MLRRREPERRGTSPASDRQGNRIHLSFIGRRDLYRQTVRALRLLLQMVYQSACRKLVPVPSVLSMERIPDSRSGNHPSLYPIAQSAEDTVCLASRRPDISRKPYQSVVRDVGFSPVQREAGTRERRWVLLLAAFQIPRFVLGYGRPHPSLRWHLCQTPSDLYRPWHLYPLRSARHNRYGRRSPSVRCQPAVFKRRKYTSHRSVVSVPLLLSGRIRMAGSRTNVWTGRNHPVFSTRSIPGIQPSAVWFITRHAMGIFPVYRSEACVAPLYVAGRCLYAWFIPYQYRRSLVD